MTDNIYMPYLMKVEKVTFEAPGVKTFMLKFVNEEDQNRFTLKQVSSANIPFSGQANQRSVLPRHQHVKDILNARSGKPVR